MIPFNYHHLYYFYIIAQEGSIARATAVLRLAQPTLSAQLKQFENFLNVKLFIRENRRLVLTEEGHKVLSYAQMIFDVGQELKDRMVDLSYAGRLSIRVGTSPYVPKTLIDLLLAFILKRHPDTNLTLVQDHMETLVRKLDDHALDLLLTDTPFEATFASDIQNTFVGKIPIVFCAHPTLARQIKAFPRDLNGRPLILPAAPRQIAYALKEYLYEHRIEARIVGEIQDIETVRRLALRGYGIAALNRLTIQEAPARQRLTILHKPSQLVVYEKVYLITKKRKQPHPVVNTVLRDFTFPARKSRKPQRP